MKFDRQLTTMNFIQQQESVLHRSALLKRIHYVADADQVLK